MKQNCSYEMSLLALSSLSFPLFCVCFRAFLRVRVLEIIQANELDRYAIDDSVVSPLATSSAKSMNSSFPSDERRKDNFGSEEGETTRGRQ